MWGGIPASILFDLADMKKEAKKRIIFLDIDGVLNTSRLRDKEILLDHEKVALLREIAFRTNSSVVISSTWRYQVNFECLKFALRCLGCNMVDIWDSIPEKLKGTYDNPNRGCYIKEWLDENEWEKYVILDDLDQDNFLESQYEFLVTTNDNYGLVQASEEDKKEIMGSSDIQKKNKEKYNS